jgi:hypothetical protein
MRRPELDGLESAQRDFKSVRLTVRALMALVLLIAAGLGWAAYRARLQRDAVAAIVKAGGKVFYEGQHLDGTEGNQASLQSMIDSCKPSRL